MFENFKNQWLGQRIDYDHVYGYQCVDLILQYIYECFGLGSGVWGNAIDYWTKTSAPLLTKFNREATSDARQGDIVILNGLPGNPYGHIGIATGNITATTVEILEQNGSTGGGSGTGGDAIRTRFISRSRVAGILRPIGQPAPTPTPSAPANPSVAGKKLFLPSAAGTWRVYPLNRSPVVGNEVGKLAPGSFPPGLTYDILANPASHIFTIQTETYGRVNIYAGPDTIAQFVDDAPAPPPPAPTPAPEPPAAPPAPPAPEKPQNITYTKLDPALELVTNKQPTNWWQLNFKDDAHATPAAQLAVGTPFHAYGKAQRTDGDKPCYYMTAEDFGQADTTGIPNNNNGINTVDLTLPAPAVQPQLEVHDNSGAPTPPAAPADDNHVPVNVVPTAPDAWKTSFKVNSAGDYTANADVVIHDLDGEGPSEQLIRGQTVHVGGEFTKAGIEYYRTKKKVEENKWYGIPKLSLTEQSLDADDDIFNLDIAESMKAELTPIGLREKAIRKAAIADVQKLHFHNPFKHKK